MCLRQTKWICLLLLATMLPGLAACNDAPPPQATYHDPYEGMVRVPDGAGGIMWIKPYEALPINAHEASSFRTEPDGRITYTGAAYDTQHGIDVSVYQGEVDWQAVADAGVDFAILRVGYRGWSEGGLFEDEWFRANLAGAQEAGLDIGCYFFSQAVTEAEAREEARFLLDILDGAALTLPIYFDWEEILDDPAARTRGLDGGLLTDCCLAFSAVIEDAGYTPGVYFYRRLGYQAYELDRLAALSFWVGALGSSPDFYYAHSIWQYSMTGRVPGIDVDVDMNLRFTDWELPEITAPDTVDASPGVHQIPTTEDVLAMPH